LLPHRFACHHGAAARGFTFLFVRFAGADSRQLAATASGHGRASGIMENAA
jgi:hypothetical protein